MKKCPHCAEEIQDGGCLLPLLSSRPARSGGYTSILSTGDRWANEGTPHAPVRGSERGFLGHVAAAESVAAARQVMLDLPLKDRLLLISLLTRMAPCASTRTP